jgi:hypothetical protein
MRGDAYEDYPERGPAWDYIGFDGDDGRLLRIVGGRWLYDAAIYSRRDRRNGRDWVKLVRLDTTEGIRQVNRYVHPDTQLELV